MTAVLQDYDVAIDDVAVEPQRKFRGAWIAGLATAAVLAVGGIIVAAVPSLHEDVVVGTATANRVEVIQAAADRKAQAEADQRSADAAQLRYLDQQVQKDVQKTLDAKDMSIPITVIDVSLIKVGPNKYEGMATMQAAGYQPHQVAIHVTADDQNIMWKIDAGGLLPLFY
jgi:hypothetical protein